MIWKFQTCFIFLIAEVSEPVQETCFTASVACKKQGQTGEKIKFNKREVYPVLYCLAEVMEDHSETF